MTMQYTTEDLREGLRCAADDLIAALREHATLDRISELSERVQMLTLLLRSEHKAMA